MSIAEDSHASDARPARWLLLCTLLVWALAVTVSFWRLGGGGLRLWDEALTAERSREMLVTGDWLTPHFALAPDFNKPPLYYALTAATISVLGKDEFSIRLWSVVFALVCLLLCERLATGIGGNRWCGLLAAVLLVTNPEWVNRTREGLLDSGMLVGLLGPLLLLTQCPRWRWTPLAAASLAALGTLVKGPFALIAYGAAAIEQLRHPKPERALRPLLISFGLTLLLALPWYVFQVWRWGWVFVERNIGHSMIERAFTSIEGHGGGPLFFLHAWMLHAPVSLALFLGAVLWCLWRDRAALRLAATPLLITLLILGAISLIASKRDLYLVWLLPTASISTALLLMPMLHTLRGELARRIAVATLVILCLVMFFVRYQEEPGVRTNEKEIALAIRAAASPGALILTVDRPVNAVLYYTELPAQMVSLESLISTIHARPQAIFVFAEDDLLPPVLGALASAEFHSSVLAQNRRYSAVRVER